MKDDHTHIADRNEQVRAFLPVAAFIVLIFLMEGFGVSKATGLVISVFVSLLIVHIMGAMLGEQHGKVPQLKPVQFRLGLMTLVFFLIVGVAVLHWYRIAHINIRWMLLFSMLLIYFVLLFSTVRTLNQVRRMLEQSQDGKK